VEAAHLPNSGRLGELLVPGQKVWLAPVDLRRSPARRTAYDLALVAFAGRLVSVDARLPGRLVAKALRHGQLTGFECYTTVQSEVRLGESRLDFRLDAGPELPPCWIEVKSVTLVDPSTDTARFPDAPTLRGQRHVRELVEAVGKGDLAAVVFVVQRDDARKFAPHDQADPTFGQVLRQAAQAGVEIQAWRCQVSLKAIQLCEPIPVVL
jgi:sugar fermentation stimulation protein A